MRDNKALFYMFPFLLLLVSCQFDPVIQDMSPSVHVISVGMTYSFSKVPALNGTYEDAAEVACSLAQTCRSSDVTFLSDRDGDVVTAQDLLTSLTDLKASQEDLLILYFSGHGSFDDKGCFLVLNSASQDYSRLYMTDLKRTLDEKGLKSLVLLDCCYAGELSDLFDERKSIGHEILCVFDRSLPSRTVVISSSLRSQTSVITSVITEDGFGEYHSLFTAELLKALGWVHSRKTITRMDGLCANGYLSSAKRGIDSTSLFQRLVSSWPLKHQKPQISRTDLRLRIN